MQRNAFDRRPAIVSFHDRSAFTESYGFAGTSGTVNLEGQFLIPSRVPSKTLFIFMHPSSTLNFLPMPSALAAAGMHVLCAASRYPKNDSALIMEKVAIDMGAWIKFARQEERYETVVLIGWSGGGSLSLFYQAQAEQPTITSTPAGDPIDLKGARLEPADGVILIAAHLSRAETLTEWMDPSVRSEIDIDNRDTELDIYDPACPHRPPYSSEFVAHFRSAQIARNRRITTWCQERLEHLKARKGPEVEWPFVVHRTMCDVRWLDPLVDPNDRKPNWCYLGDPRTANVVPAGLARYSSLRSWLSQWSFDLSNARSAVNAPLVKRSKVLQIENTADDAVPATHARRVYELLSTPNKELIQIKGATHYYQGQSAHLEECIGTVNRWCRENQFEL
jgi:pimeloyl-ACP methyl ester carboxylesterase